MTNLTNNLGWFYGQPIWMVMDGFFYHWEFQAPKMKLRTICLAISMGIFPENSAYKIGYAGSIPNQPVPAMAKDCWWSPCPLKPLLRTLVHHPWLLRKKGLYCCTIHMAMGQPNRCQTWMVNSKTHAICGPPSWQILTHSHIYHPIPKSEKSIDV